MTENYQIIGAFSVIALLSLSILIISQLPELQQQSPAGELAAPGKCYYKTVPGEFIVTSTSSDLFVTCQFVGDNNYDPFVKGGINLVNISELDFYDICKPMATMGIFTEYYCENSTTMRVNVGVCNNGCTLIQVLNDTLGYCNKGNVSNVRLDRYESGISCETFFDNNDPFSLGGVILMVDKGGNLTEQCRGNSLTEYSCKANGEILVSTYGECTLGCNNGACIKSKKVLTCLDDTAAV